jgi:UDP-2,3-diacylglucosamine pyrophosphatase LpxH
MFTTDILIVSDLHLGSNHSKAKEFMNVMRHKKPRCLVLLGDIVDLLKKDMGQWKWTQEEQEVILWITSLINTPNQAINTHGTCVVFIRGNHDKSYVPPFSCDIMDEMYYTTPNGDKYLLIHGDIFDHKLMQDWPTVYKIGDMLYENILDLSIYFGLDKCCFPAIIKSAFKRLMTNHKKHAAKYAAERSCVGVVSGHIHWPEETDIKLPAIKYLNSGSWVKGEISAYVEEVNGHLCLKTMGSDF